MVAEEDTPWKLAEDPSDTVQYHPGSVKWQQWTVKEAKVTPDGQPWVTVDGYSIVHLYDVDKGWQRTPAQGDVTDSKHKSLKAWTRECKKAWQLRTMWRTDHFARRGRALTFVEMTQDLIRCYPDTTSMSKSQLRRALLDSTMWMLRSVARSAMKMTAPQLQCLETNLEQWTNENLENALDPTRSAPGAATAVWRGTIADQYLTRITDGIEWAPICRELSCKHYALPEQWLHNQRTVTDHGQFLCVACVRRHYPVTPMVGRRPQCPAQRIIHIVNELDPESHLTGIESGVGHFVQDGTKQQMRAFLCAWPDAATETLQARIARSYHACADELDNMPIDTMLAHVRSVAAQSFLPIKWEPVYMDDSRLGLLKQVNDRSANAARPYRHGHLPFDTEKQMHFARMRRYIYDSGTHILDVGDLGRFYGCLLTTIKAMTSPGAQ
jgi:hypothetical protein